MPATPAQTEAVAASPSDPPTSERAEAEVVPASTPTEGRSAVERVVAYFVALGVEGEPALRFTNTLDARIDPAETDPARRATQMLEAFDRWADGLPAALGVTDAADRVAFVAATHLGRLLNQHPEALDDPAGFVESMRPLLDAKPHGVLPNLPRQEMHRQPLGDLPAVLQGEFWSGTYRWVGPVGASTKRMLRGPKKMLDEADAAAQAAAAPNVAAEGPASGE